VATRDIGNHPQQVAALIPVYHHTEFKYSVYCHLKFKIAVYATNLHVEFDKKDLACGMSSAASWLRCSVCHRTGPNRGAIRSHQRAGAPRTAALLARANKCAGGGVERVTTVPAHGLLCARQVVTEDAPSRNAAAPAAPMTHDDADDNPYDDLDRTEHEQASAGARASAAQRMQSVLLPVCLGGLGPENIGARGGQEAPETAVPRQHAVLAAPLRVRLQPTEQKFLQYRAQHNLSSAAATHLLQWVKHPSFDAADLRFRCAESYDRLLTDVAVHGVQHASMYDPAIDGTNACDVWFRTAESIVLGLLEDPALAPFMDYRFRPTFDEHTGERVFTGINDSLWLEGEYARLGPDSDITIVPVIPCSDATIAKKRLVAHPAYVTTGLLSDRARRSDAAWRLAALVPQYKQSDMAKHAGTTEGSLLDFKRRKAALLQGTIAKVLAGFKNQDTVHTVKCGDGVVRRVRLVLCTYPTDRQEQEVRHT
jgi:hypothetical protein